MKRNVSLEEISDGKLYGINDMVKVDCHGCRGCSRCCKGMGNSIVLDPYDIYNIKKATGLSFGELIGSYIELNVVDGVVLPNIFMGEGDKCSFLNSEGRCSIHANRPGICRLFPLGRYYEDGDYKYIIQVGECTVSNPSKVKVSKWLGINNQKRYHDFIVKWHYFINDLEEKVKSNTTNDYINKLNMMVLNTFYVYEWNLEGDFYDEFDTVFSKFYLPE